MKNISKSFENATRLYYGSDRDPLKLVPVVSDRDVAHKIAQDVDKRLEAITEEELTKSAITAIQFNRYSHELIGLEKMKEFILQDRLNIIVVNAEITHARLAPNDFHEDAMESGAYEMGNGIVVAPQPNPDDLRQ